MKFTPGSKQFLRLKLSYIPAEYNAFRGHGRHRPALDIRKQYPNTHHCHQRAAPILLFYPLSTRRCQNWICNISKIESWLETQLMTSSAIPHNPNLSCSTISGRFKVSQIPYLLRNIETRISVFSECPYTFIFLVEINTHLGVATNAPEGFVISGTIASILSCNLELR